MSGWRVAGVAYIIGATMLALAACAGSANGPDKAGGSGRPVTLTLGTPDSAGQPDAPLIEYFADQVRAISGGRLLIKIDYTAAGDANNFEQVTVGKVRRGSLDLGWVGSRVWDTEGVLAFQALQAPFLITNYQLLDRVTTGPIAREMLAGLDHVGVVGLGLYPDELRHPAGFGKPLLSLADFRGANIRVPASNATDDLVRALGARPVHLNGPALVQAVDDGELRGAETSVGNAASLPGPPIVTGNITFFPRAITLFAAAKTFAGLSDSQRQALQAAAQRTLHFAVRRRPAAWSSAKFCALGGAIVLAAKPQVAEIVHAGDAVYKVLERDQQTKSFIARIRQMKTGGDATPSTPAPCGTVAGSGR
ncbi:MAG TPA: TRAP transporter substrate-binding protein DctP [Jatrophihabitans sp.]|nr:TRAP transporter substrate-binding protein DctP [Jatrophihabitans sp.]